MIARIAPIVLAFGANLSDRAATIAAAQQELAAHPEITQWQSSPLVCSAKVTPDGVDESGPQYLNGVATAVTTLEPLQLLRLVQQIEIKYGRVRREKWGDRTLDIDIISYAGVVQRSPELTLPHPLAHTRDFVLAPWLLLDPHAVLLRHGRVAELLQQLGDTTEVYYPPETAPRENAQRQPIAQQQPTAPWENAQQQPTAQLSEQEQAQQQPEQRRV